MMPASTAGSIPSAAPSAIASDTPIIEIPSSRLLQIFAICPVPVPPHCTTFLPMSSSTGRMRSNSAASAPTMKVSVPACAPPVPPDTGASAKREAALRGGLGHRAHGARIDRAAVDQRSAGACAGQHAVIAEVDRAHVLRGRQHRDHDRAARGCFTRRAGGRRAGAHRDVHCVRVEVEHRQRVAGFQQVGGHRAAHVAESDECDFHVRSRGQRSAIVVFTPPAVASSSNQRAVTVFVCV